jgi:hypothetical protein
VANLFKSTALPLFSHERVKWMSYDEKVDVIDFIINVLKEHEKNLDTQVAKLEDIMASDRTPRPYQEPPKRVSLRVKVALNKWTEFRERITKPQMLAFTITDDGFQVSALKDDTLYIYQEKVPEISMTIEREGERTTTKGGNFGDLFDNLSLIGGELQCGLHVEHKKVELELPNSCIVQKLIFEIDNEATKSWLSEQLNIEKSSIMFGTMEI